MKYLEEDNIEVIKYYIIKKRSILQYNMEIL